MRTLIILILLATSVVCYSQQKEADPEYPTSISLISKGGMVRWAEIGQHPKRIQQHPDGRWFRVVYDDKILMSLPAQQNVDTVWYEIKEVSRTRGRITLK